MPNPRMPADFPEHWYSDWEKTKAAVREDLNGPPVKIRVIPMKILKRDKAPLKGGVPSRSCRDSAAFWLSGARINTKGRVGRRKDTKLRPDRQK